MVRSKSYLIVFLLFCLGFTRCTDKINRKGKFYEFKENILIDHWQYGISVDEQKLKSNHKASDSADHYLKATLFLSNAKTKKSLLYSVSDEHEDYEAKYKYLAFESGNDFYIKFKNDYIYAIGYVFEPSNGLSITDRLIYKFKINDKMFKQMVNDNQSVEYWYIDRFVGLGKICFTHKN